MDVFSGALPGAVKYLEGSLVGGRIEMLAILEVEQVSRSRLNERECKNDSCRRNQNRYRVNMCLPLF